MFVKNGKAIVNKDASAFNNYRTQRQLLERAENKERSLVDRIESLEQRISVLENIIKENIDV